jgi:hypothetical protein
VLYSCRSILKSKIPVSCKVFIYGNFKIIDKISMEQAVFRNVCSICNFGLIIHGC